MCSDCFSTKNSLESVAPYLISIITNITHGTSYPENYILRRVALFTVLCSLTALSIQLSWTSPRTISNAQLHTDLAGCFYLRPINQVVFLGPYWINSMGFLILRWASYLYAFSTYPLQTQLLCVYRWRDNRYTGGLSVPVLSY